MTEKPPNHDGQGDAMPCACPACQSPFIAARRRTESGRPGFTEVIDNIATGRACLTWCGDACTCGRGPESGDLDALDVAGMRAIEGRT